MPIFVSVFSAPPCHSANCGNLVGWEELPYVLLSTFFYSHTVWCNKWQSVASLARNHLVNQAAACWSPGPTLPISPLKLSGPFINLGTNQKYAKAHHSLNSHISSSCIPPKLAAKKILTNRANFRKTHIHPKFWKAGRKFEDECVMSGSLHELLRERAAPVQE